MCCCSCVHIYVFLHIYWHASLSVDGKGSDEGREWKKWRVDEGGENELLQSGFLILSNSMV